MGDVVSFANRAERRRLEREGRKAAEQAAKAQETAARKEVGATPPLDLADLRTVLLGAGAFSIGHPPFGPGEARDAFRGACDRVAAFLDMELGWPEDPPASGLDLPRRPTLILPGS